MRHFFLALTLLITSFTALADDRYIRVSAESSIEVMPDYLELNLSLEATEPSLKAAKQKVDKAMKALLASSKKNAVDEKDIDAAQISNRPVYQWNKQGREYQGEQVSRRITITLRDLSRYASLTHQLLDIAEIRIHGSQMKFNDRQALENQILAKAVVAARVKADKMATAAGSELGEVLTIQEQSSHVPQPMMAMSMARMEKAADPSPAPMLIQKQRLTASVTLSYELK
ncbi:SIMPL domain-containing protein [Bacterioplanoides pacificum]|uniref:SIMPL domain-containing protein n=1 Tax=Bacterioplanoides pacificum TaxID=1171596 RepID=A0ABV7VNA5_9GAMM